MKTIVAILLALAIGAFAIAHAQQAPPSGGMGPGMMARHAPADDGSHATDGRDDAAVGRDDGERSDVARADEAMKQMGAMMGSLGARGGSSIGPMAMPEMAMVMEQMADMQKRRSEMMGTPK